MPFLFISLTNTPEFCVMRLREDFSSAYSINEHFMSVTRLSLSHVITVAFDFQKSQCTGPLSPRPSS